MRPSELFPHIQCIPKCMVSVDAYRHHPECPRRFVHFMSAEDQVGVAVTVMTRVTVAAPPTDPMKCVQDAIQQTVALVQQRLGADFKVRAG